MIAGVIQWSLDNRVIVVLSALILFAAGLFSIARTPLDAIPDLSDVQVIIKTHYSGQAPQVVEDQVTYPLTTAMLAVPRAVTVPRLFIFWRFVCLRHFPRTAPISIGHARAYSNT